MKIAGYLTREKIYRGNNFTVYRAIREEDTVPCVLKILDKKAARSLQIIDEIEKEYEFLNQVDNQYVIKAVDWLENKDYTGIALEDINGKDLKNYLQGSLFPFKQFMDTAVQITTGLAAVHSENIVHRDVNPGNIILDSQSSRLKIIDFNIASKFNIKVSYLGNPEKLRGTLPYISPEQTGRMNRRVDHRSDLYSLGVTFYEMLTGQLPFGQRKPMEIVYAHLARMPEPPHLVKEEVPKILSDMILKLLAKDPGERYQSAEGLKYDLEKIRKASLTGFENLADFKSGEKDFPGKLQIPEKLYGRREEIEQLLNAYQRASSGAKEIILVSGYAGTGKTALVNEIHKPITKNYGYFVSGKFDQLQRNVPYFAFIQAFNQFCQLLLTEKQEILTKWNERILGAVGQSGKVLTDIIPQLESIIGKQPDIPEVGGEEAKRRFHYVFQQFLQVVSNEEHPLVMFIDDLQWADLDSLNLLRVMMEDRQSHYLLFIGAYRDNEVSGSHPLMMTIEEVQQQDISLKTIPLKNLSLENVREWVTDTLQAKSDPGHEMVAPLADLIFKKTQGNAFFTIQFMENLYRENLLRFDFKQSLWTSDIKDIEKLNITDNVVDLLVRKIKMLSPSLQGILKLAACIGNNFQLHALSIISEKKEGEHRKILEIALGEDLVLPQGHEVYKFVHDRIHQAAYSLVPDEDKKPLHLEIGRLLLKDFQVSKEAKISKEEEQKIFEIVNHFNTGIELVENEKEKLEVTRLNLIAGQNAKMSAAYKLGAEYIRRAIDLLPKDCWQQHYDLTLTIYNEAVQTSYLCGNYEEMENFVETLVNSTTNILDNTIAYEYRMMGFNIQNKQNLVTEMLLDTFNKMGVRIPPKPGKLRMLSLFFKIQAAFKLTGQEKLKNLPEMNNPRKQFVTRLLSIGVTSFLFSAQELLAYVLGKMMGVSLKYGMTPDTPYIFALYGIVRKSLGDISGAYQMGKLAMDLKDKIHGNEIIKPRIIITSCIYALAWKLHFKEVCKLLVEAYQGALNVGDLENVGYTLTNHIQYLSCTDTALPIYYEKALSAKEKVTELNQPLIIAILSVQIEVALNLLAQCVNPAILDIDINEITREIPSVKMFVARVAGVKKICLAYLFEDYPRIPGYIEEVEEYMKDTTSVFVYQISDWAFYVPLAYLQLYTITAAKKDKKRYLGKAKEGIKVMKKWAEVGPVNFLHKYYLMQAELYRITGKTGKAVEFYDKAVEKAHDNEYINESALANELAAKFYMQNNQHKLAALYFMEARECYSKWGAKAKVKHLEENYPKYLRMTIPDSTITGTISSASAFTSDLLDVRSIIKASQTLSGEVQLKRLLEKMMKILIENAGAQKCLLIENSDEQLLIQAEGNTDGVSGVLQALAIEKSEKVPLSVINYVTHSKQKLVFDNLSKDANYSTDHYIQTHQPRSVVCFPISSKGKLSSILYLENNLVEGAFTPARLEILNMLSSQIAISVENTQLYEQLEEKVRQRTLALKEANEELKRRHKKINDSVNYASRIQEAVLPSRENLTNLFPEHFLLYRPCAVVSGDFYWVKEVKDRIIVAAADCTGHGVPGALLSMLGISFLNEIVLHLTTESRLSCNNILDQLRTQMKSALQQQGRQSRQKEGMDIALCIIDPGNKQLQYAGAHNPLYLIRDGQLIEVKADKMPVGISPRERPFTNHDLAFQSGDIIYLFSDGYADQNSETAIEKKFTRKQFIKLLLEINQEPMSKQEEILAHTFDRWKGNLPQRDDVLIIGIRF